MKRILPYFQYLANVALVVLFFESLDIEIIRGSLQNTTAVYLVIALLLHGFESWLFDRIRGKS